MNQCNFIGRLTKDPEVTTTAAGISVLKTTIAVDRRFKKEDGTKETDFINIVAWRGLADTIAKYCKRGSLIYVSGELQIRSYEADDGTKRWATDMVINDCQFLSTKQDSSDSEPVATPIADDGLPF